MTPETLKSRIHLFNANPPHGSEIDFAVSEISGKTWPTLHAAIATMIRTLRSAFVLHSNGYTGRPQEDVMDESSSHMKLEIKALADAYAALNRHDVAGFVACFDPQIVRIEPADFPLAGTYRGIEAVTAHVAQGRGTWAEGSCEPQRFIAAGDRVVVIFQVRVRLHNAADWIEGRAADVFTFRNGKAIEYHTFGQPHDAMAYADVDAAAD